MHVKCDLAKYGSVLHCSRD